MKLWLLLVNKTPMPYWFADTGKVDDYIAAYYNINIPTWAFTGNVRGLYYDVDRDIEFTIIQLVPTPLAS